jgi:hypothetical protein
MQRCAQHKDRFTKQTVTFKELVRSNEQAEHRAKATDVAGAGNVTNQITIGTSN